MKTENKGARIYGQSDDLIEFDGDVYGEVNAYGTDDDDHPGILVICSDGTLLAVKYGKFGRGIWEVKLVRQGSLFDRIELCDDEDAVPYSDVAHFKPGLRWAYSARQWEKVR